MLLEDEHGQANLIVPPQVYEQHRAIVRGEPLILARGKLERHGRNVNLLVASVESLGPLARKAASEAEVTRCAPARPPLRPPLSARTRRVGALVHRAVVVREVVRRVDEADVRERLREVAEQPLRRRVVLLGEQADVVARAPSSRSNSARASSRAAEQRERVDEPERARQERRPRRRGRPSTSSVAACGSAATKPSRDQLALRSRRPCRRTRGSSAGRKPTSGISSRRRVELVRAVGLGERVRARRRTPRAQTSAWISLAELPPAVDRARRGRSARPPATARSNATQAITFECVKCRRGAAHLPDALVGLGPRRPRGSRAASRCSAQAWSSAGEAVRARLVQRVHHLAVDVELELLVRGVADPHRRASPRSRAASRARTRRGGARRRRRT